MFRDQAHGGWRYSVDAAGRPLDPTQDLYTHAFIVFACAAYFRRSRNAQARKLLLATAETIESRFRMADGRYHAALSQDWSEALRGPAQNPMMHLTEAYLAAAQVAEPALFAARLRGLAQVMSQVFLSAPTQCIAELPQGTPGNRIEPGHQFEWLSLVRESAEVFDGLDLPESLPRGVHWARGHGVDAGGVLAALDERGAVLDDTRRIWAQTEYLRVLAVLGDLPAEGLFGLTADQLRSAEAVCHATVQDEHWVLTQLLWHGFPDPPEWGLWTRPRNASGQPWTSWGQFAHLPPAWRLPPGVD